MTWVMKANLTKNYRILIIKIIKMKVIKIEYKEFVDLCQEVGDYIENEIENIINVDGINKVISKANMYGHELHEEIDEFLPESYSEISYNIKTDILIQLLHYGVCVELKDNEWSFSQLLSMVVNRSDSDEEAQFEFLRRVYTYYTNQYLKNNNK